MKEANEALLVSGRSERDRSKLQLDFLKVMLQSIPQTEVLGLLQQMGTSSQNQARAESKQSETPLHELR